MYTVENRRNVLRDENFNGSFGDGGSGGGGGDRCQWITPKTFLLGKDRLMPFSFF